MYFLVANERAEIVAAIVDPQHLRTLWRDFLLGE